MTDQGLNQDHSVFDQWVPEPEPSIFRGWKTMDIQLISTGLTNLDPGYYRSPGVHASTLLDRICRRLGHYEHKIDKTTGERIPISDRNRELGNSLEHSIAQRVQTRYPGRYIHNPEIHCDNIFITPDLIKWEAERETSWSIKLTWMSAARGPDDTKMWKYLEQLKAELYALRRVVEGTAQVRKAVTDEREVDWVQYKPSVVGNRFLSGLLTVCFVNDWRPESEQIPTWRLKFWPEELAMTWAMLREEKEMMEAEEMMAALGGIDR